MSAIPPSFTGTHRFMDHDLYQVTLDDEGLLVSIICGNQAVACRDARDDLSRMPGEVSIVAPDCLLKDIVEIRQMTGRPVLVADEGRITGFCGANEILAALTHAGRSSYSSEIQ